MVLLYYFIGTAVLGIIPAIIAMQSKRNFFAWWLYGALLLPAALIHSVFLLLKLNRGMFIVYTLIIVHAIAIFYFITWFFTTQPISIKQAEISEAKYKTAELILKNRDVLVAGETKDLKKYVAEQTKLPQADIDSTLEYFDDTVLTDKDKLTAFALDLLLSLDKIYKYISDKGAFEEFSVPMGDASKVFTYYIESLVLINQYLGDNSASIESNLESILSTEQMYFKTTKYAKPFLDHLDTEAEKNNPKDRMLTIIEHYLSIGKILLLNAQRQDAKRCNNSAIDMYNKILSDTALTLKEREGFFYKIAEAQDKNGDADSIIKSFDSYLTLMFNSALYTDNDTVDQVQKFVKLATIAGKHENLTKTVQTFMDLSEKYKQHSQADIANMENSMLTEVFVKLSGSERNKFAKVIDTNYKILVGTDDLNTLPIVQKAFVFFEDSMYPTIADFYMATAKKLFEKLLGVEDGIITDYNALSERVAAANDRVVQIIDATAPLSAKEKADARAMKAAIEVEAKRLEQINTIIKTGRGVIAEMIDPKASQDETFKIESSTRDAVREYNDNYSVIEEQLK